VIPCCALLFFEIFGGLGISVAVLVPVRVDISAGATVDGWCHGSRSLNAISALLGDLWYTRFAFLFRHLRLPCVVLRAWYWSLPVFFFFFNALLRFITRICLVWTGFG